MSIIQNPPLLPMPPADHALLAIVFGALTLGNVLLVSRDMETAIMPAMALLVLIAVGFFAFSQRHFFKTPIFAMYAGLLSWPFLFFVWVFPAGVLLLGPDSPVINSMSLYQKTTLLFGFIQFLRMLVILLISAKNRGNLVPPENIQGFGKSKLLIVAAGCGLASYFVLDVDLSLRFFNALAVSTIAIDILKKIFERLPSPRVEN